MDSALLSGNGMGRRAGDRWVWRGLSFALQAGERVALVGPSGSGKTMLMRALANLDPLDEGQIVLDGRSLGEWPPSAYRARVMYVHQRPVLLPGKVDEDLRIPFRFKVHRTQPYDEERARDLLTSLGRSADLLSQDATTLSGGEGQIVALVRAVLLDPEVLLLDEPTASMDPATTSRAEALVEAWIRSGARRACLWTSHDPAQLDRVATRRLTLDQDHA